LDAHAFTNGPVILDGLGGADTLAGGSRNDTLTGGAGADALSGNGGDDTVQARDSEVDTSIDCGDGTADVANLDTADPATTGCEMENRPDVTPPPEPTITGHPSNPSDSASASFTFTDTEAGVSFLCSLDGANPPTAPCSSGVSYGSLGAGSHTFRLAAKDAAGNVSTVASYTWTIAFAAPPPPPPPPPPPFKPPACVVPKVIGKPLAAAKSALAKAHCSLGKLSYKPSAKKLKGRVLAESPKPGKKLANKAKVNLTVGRGPKK
jgi:hypothetical protein